MMQELKLKKLRINSITEADLELVKHLRWSILRKYLSTKRR